MFQRSLPGEERCTICPFRPVGTDRAAGTYPPRPVLPFLPSAGPHHHTAPHQAAAHRPAAMTPHAASHRSAATRPTPANAPPATLPRPALLATDLRGSGTLVLPDALRSAGPDAATIERPGEPYPHPLDTRSDAPRHPLAGRAARDPDFDELASPDITVLQATAMPVSRPMHRRPPAAITPARTYLALNICLGLLILVGLVLLATRAVTSTAPSVSASE
ncbi:MAG: hypothetical protein H0T76_03685 [Nannocystis sp.]|nr:hypothetical protein [Nannocystis sp.]MBA3545563.1 hypothetical protein [Nannocystis sp.]